MKSSRRRMRFAECMWIRRFAGYVAKIVRATRDHDAVRTGKPRASLALFRASQAYAAVQGLILSAR